MKTAFILLIALSAGSLSAQMPPFDPWVRTQIPQQTRENRLILRPQDTYIYQGSRFTLDGVGVEITKADNPLELFDPFNEDTLATARDNTVWDSRTGNAIGFNLFSIHF